MHDVYLITGFREPLPPRRRFHMPRIVWKAPTWHNHFSILVDSHLFHITSEMASDKIGYFTKFKDGSLPLVLRVDDISSPESRLHDKRLRAEYCGRTHYDIDHIKFYCDCLIDQWRTYSIARSNCLMWSFALAAYVVDRETTSIRDLWANPHRLMTLNELRRVEARRDGEEQEEVPAGPKRRTLTFYLRERAIRVSLLADAVQPKARLRLDAEERLPPFVSRETKGPDIVPSYMEYLWSDDEMWTSMIFSDKLSRLRKPILRV
ncbi:hypothetical protein NA56DRAFT_21217 [Hyaloscypha hepaticicola]|uniref:Uncharacterized protein n=1 Tax=Hyaloscypha hepaticicola TaxID=2082293 RepID=A0A2J6QQZ1_9HELO|nr:hypothetical protein NA56DRAFT_21217 [Hyaloscypha hepaticicola]